MTFQRSRRDLLTAALASSALAACGGGTIQSSFTPSRGVLLDGASSNFAAQVLSGYGSVTVVAPTGGVNSSMGSTPITDLTIGTPTLAQRIDTLLAGGVTADDLVIISGGVPDILAAATAGSPAAAAAAAGAAMGAQIRRLVDAGARHVLVANTYDVSRSPFGQGNAALFSSLTRAFNDQLKISIVDLGRSVLLVDAELYFNQVIANPGAYGFSNATAAACAGSSAGDGTVSSSNCTTGSFSGNNPNTFLFYDPVFLTPAGQISFASSAFATARARW